MRKTLLSAPMLALAMWAIPTDAAAVSCPATIGGTITRQYTLETSSACQYGDGNITGGQNDDFLDGNNSQVGVGDFSGFTSGTSSGNASGGNATAGNLTFNADGTWSLANAVSGTTYAIGIVDGGSPKWAVFLVTATTSGTITGTWSITKCDGSCPPTTTDNTALSHIVLYNGTGGGGTGGGGTGGGGAPEPASLALFGLGLLGAGYRLRRRLA